MSNEDLHDFSAKGREAFEQILARLRTTLRNTARNVSTQGRADTTSAEHVMEAYRMMSAPAASRGFQGLGALGMLLLGVGLGQLASMVADGQYPPAGVWIVAALCVIGGLLAPLTWVRRA